MLVSCENNPVRSMGWRKSYVYLLNELRLAMCLDVLQYYASLHRNSQ